MKVDTGDVRVQAWGRWTLNECVIRVLNNNPNEPSTVNINTHTHTPHLHAIQYKHQHREIKVSAIIIAYY